MSLQVRWWRGAPCAWQCVDDADDGSVDETNQHSGWARPGASTRGTSSRWRAAPTLALGPRVLGARHSGLLPGAHGCSVLSCALLRGARPPAGRVGSPPCVWAGPPASLPIPPSPLPPSPLPTTAPPA